MCAGARRLAPGSKESRLSWSELYPTRPSFEKDPAAAAIFSPGGETTLPRSFASCWPLRLPLLAACGGSSSPNTTTPTPLTVASRRATAGPTHYNTGDEQIATRERSGRRQHHGFAHVLPDRAERPRQLTIAYDNAQPGHPLRRTAAKESGPVARRRRRHREAAGAGCHRPRHHRDRDAPGAGHTAPRHRRHRRHALRTAIGLSAPA